jgi:CheY-like chemotaxis protein
MKVVVFVGTDMFFQARIAAAARARAVTVQFLTTLQAVEFVEDFALAIVDLDARLDVLAAIRLLRARGPVVAFGPHLDADKLKAARAAGAQRVLARSKFVAELPQLIDVGAEASVE